MTAHKSTVPKLLAALGKEDPHIVLGAALSSEHATDSPKGRHRRQRQDRSPEELFAQS